MMKANIARNPDWEKWKSAGMIYNRYRQVVAHRKLMTMVEADDLDMDGVKVVLKELINAAMPVSADELEVIMRIEAGETAAQVTAADFGDKSPVI